MAYTKIPSHTSLVDGQFLQVEGPNSITSGYAYDQQQRALYFKESQILAQGYHGQTHIAEDPIPNATCDTPGLLSADDKCKLDAVLQTRLGVIGFQGGGFPDDGGWMSGDIILAAGTEFISLERIGNVIRFTVDSPVQLNVTCEECQQIFWVQDETDVASIRVPSCSGKLPGVNAYGEVKVYLFPESTIADPNNVAATLNNKGNYPSMIFKRYDDTIVPGAAEYDLVLKRDSVNRLQTEIGWAFTPGSTGIVECVWFTGKDKDGNQTRFELEPDTEPNLLGALLYKGHLVTKKMAVIVDYTNTILSTNQYILREWDLDGSKVVGETFTAKNVWQYINPENPQSGLNPLSLILDGTIDLLPIGTIVELWWFKIAEVAGEPIRRYYFSKKPTINPNHMWSMAGHVQFGDTDTAREELTGTNSYSRTVPSTKQFESTLWGLTGFDDPLVSFDIASTAGTESADISQWNRAIIDTDFPGLRIIAADGTPSNYSERPVILWNRQNFCNAIVRCEIARPTDYDFVPYDIILRAPVDSSTTKYMHVTGTGQLEDGTNYISVCGVHFHDLPQFGHVRVISPENRGIVYEYNRKLMFPSKYGGTGTDHQDNCNTIILAGGPSSNVQYSGGVGDIVELLHEEYNSIAVRVEFSYNEGNGLIETQFKVGILDMSLPYEDDQVSDADDFIRGLAPGYAVSAVYSQAGTYTGIGAQPSAVPDGFVVYDGGRQIGGDLQEYWNKLEIMLKDGQVWIWWNQLLIPPNALLSSNLPSPVSVQTPYFPVAFDRYRPYGKVGMRLWPGAVVRKFDVRTQVSVFSEFTYGQLEVT